MGMNENTTILTNIKHKTIQIIIVLIKKQQKPRFKIKDKGFKNGK